MRKNKIRFPFLCMPMLTLGLGTLVGPERAMAQRPIGIDVSDYQSASINWNTLKNTYGIVFGWAKISEGTASGAGSGGGNFKTYAANAKAAGVVIGAYHYARYDLHGGTAGATAEATVFWNAAKNYLVGGGYYIMPMLDVEASFTGQTKATISAWVNQWCLTVSNNAAAAGVPGLRPCIYASSSKAATYLDSTVTQWFTDIANWPYAHASAAAQAQAAPGPPAGIAPWSNWQFWQYDDQNVAQAITTGDGDIFNGTLAQLIATMVIGGTFPTITNQPASLTVVAGADATFTVGVSGAAPFSYQWRFDGGSVAGATDSSYTKTNAQTSDIGSYSVVVSNQFGATTSADALLTVLGPPSIIGQPQSQVVSVGQDATFTVTAAGPPPMSYQWLFDGNPLAGTTNSSCILTAVRGVNAGSYSVVVSNGYGSVVSTNAALSVIQDAAWGDNTFVQGSPSGISTNLIAIAAGGWHNLGLGAGGTVSAWGNDSSGQCDVPATLTDALAIAAGGYHSLALRANGTVVAWGANDSGQASVPEGLAGVIGIAAGTWHSVALRANGTVAIWGDNSFGQANQPPGLANVTAVAAGGSHTLALKADGTVVAWGENTAAEGNVAGQSAVPFGLANVVAIGAGEYHSLAVKGDGTVVAWGDNSQDQCNVPPGLTNVVAAAGGGAHTLALGADGKVTAWGADWNGQCDIPQPLAPVSGIAAGEYHTVVVLADSLPVPELLDPAWKGHGFSALAQTLSPRNYALEYKDSLAATNWTAVSTNAGNGALRLLTDPAANGAQRFYRMRQW
jgi:GH25 family lysozyme M1 (1,4-beta-N-acetylmuramidase)